MMKLFLSKHWKPVALAISIVLLISFGALTSAQAQPRTSVASPTPPGLLINPAGFVQSNIQLPPPLPDLIVTNITSNQAGYQPGDNWQVTVEVTNIGGAPSGHFQVLVSINPHPTAPYLGNEQLIVGEINNLEPGEIDTVTSPQYDFSNLPPDPALTDTWVPGFANSGLVDLNIIADYLILPIRHEVEESDETNNYATLVIVYPSAPEGADYDPTLDADGDGFYPPSAGGNDCDDSDPAVHPGVDPSEDLYGDGIDQDCSGGDNPVLPPGWASQDEYPNDYIPDWDYDSDGYSFNQGDCNDFDPSINPGQDEIDNGLDDDCDRLVDEGWDFPDPGVIDLDSDGYTADEGDCDDLHGHTHPGAAEFLDGQDNDCDGFIDEGVVTPDWVITDFSINHLETNCPSDYEPAPGDSAQPSCGLTFSLTLENQGDDLGPLALPAVRQSIYVTDLVNQYPVDTYIPYSSYSSFAMMDLMACGPMGMFAVIPSFPSGGQFAEDNTSNNVAIAYVEGPENGGDIDIVFDRPVIFFPNQHSFSGLSGENSIVVLPRGFANGTCPPPESVNFKTRVRIFHEGNQVFSDENELVEGIDPNFALQFDPRPSEGDEIVVEMLLNSDGAISEDTSNNLCIITLSYDHAFGLGGRGQDRMTIEDTQGCSGSIYSQDGIASFGVDQTGQTLLGGSPVFLAVLLVSILLGGGLGWQVAVRIGTGSQVGIVAIALVGASLGGALGMFVGGQVMDGGIEPLPGGEIPEVQVDALAASLPETFHSLAVDEPDFCSAFINTSVGISTAPSGQIDDINIELFDSGENRLPENSRFTLSIWDGAGGQHRIVTDQPSISLADAGLFPGIVSPFNYFVAVESTTKSGGDRYLPICVPDEVQQINAELFVDFGKELVGLNLDEGRFFGCDLKDPECHVWARLEFKDYTPQIILDFAIRTDLVENVEKLGIQLETTLDFIHNGDTVAQTSSQLQRLDTLSPVGEPISYGSDEFFPYSLVMSVPDDLVGTFDLAGSISLIAGPEGTKLLVLDEVPVMADNLDSTPPTPTSTPSSTPIPTVTPMPPTFTPTVVIPTPTYTVAPSADKKGPKVSGANASPNPALTTSPVSISANISDPSGVDSALVYYRKGKKSYQLAGPMKAGGGKSYTLNIGSLTPAGSYDFRILASDNLGNTNCSSGKLSSCPGGTFQVNIP